LSELRLKKKALMFFSLVTIAIVAGSSAIYVYFFLPQTLSSAETARRMEGIYSRTIGILDFMSGDMQELVDRNITATVFSTRMDDLKADMLDVRAGLTELKKVALSTYVESINLLDRGLQAYGDAIDYAHDLNFNQTSNYLEQGTEYVNRSKTALPPS
jgi:hypothetical protein